MSEKEFEEFKEKKGWSEGEEDEAEDMCNGIHILFFYYSVFQLEWDRFIIHPKRNSLYNLIKKTAV